jgi:hypothetical protein
MLLAGGAAVRTDVDGAAGPEEHASSEVLAAQTPAEPLARTAADPLTQLLLA